MIGVSWSDDGKIHAVPNASSVDDLWPREGREGDRARRRTACGLVPIRRAGAATFSAGVHDCLRCTTKLAHTREPRRTR